MATTKKTTTSAIKENRKIESKGQEVLIDSEGTATEECPTEKELALTKQVEDLQRQISEMMAMMSVKPTAEPAKSNRKITFVNLTNGKLILKGSKNWEIEGIYNSRDFLEKEAELIVMNMPKTIQSGKVYIANAQFVEDNDLGDIYANILSDKELKDLLNHDANYVIETYKNVEDGQKEVIIDLIIEKKMQGESVDYNVLVELGKLSGRDLMNIE